MAYTEKRVIGGSALTAASVDYYTVPASTTAIVKELIFCNTDTVSRTFTVYVTPTSGTTPAAQYAVFNAVTIQPNETKIFGLTSVLPAGYTVKALASSAGVVAFNGSAIERT